MQNDKCLLVGKQYWDLGINEEARLLNDVKQYLRS